VPDGPDPAFAKIDSAKASSPVIRTSAACVPINAVLRGSMRAAFRTRAFRSNEIAELRRRDASKRECRRVVAQGDPVQCAEGITSRERTRRGCDQRGPSESRHTCHSHHFDIRR
jgi:hypothetical protein